MEGDSAGLAVAAAGDVNGDGHADIIIGAPNAGRLEGDPRGEAYVVFGGPGGFGATAGPRQVVDLATLGDAQSFVIGGATALDQAGFGVSAAGG